MHTQETAAISVDLTAVIIALAGDAPRVLVIQPRAGPGRDEERTASGSDSVLDSLPSGPLRPEDSTLDSGLRAWVKEQTRLELGYVEQLYTFGDRNRAGSKRDDGSRNLSVGYLALTRDAGALPDSAAWESWYRYFPWEDWRQGRPATVAPLRTQLRKWGAGGTNPAERASRRDRIATTFGRDDAEWTEDRVLERYELLFEAGLVPEAGHTCDGRAPGQTAFSVPAQPMAADHRRILATAIGRLRGKIRYRPVVFELMPHGFTLLQLQRAVEALIGAHLHKQNFRRLVEEQGLVEETGRVIGGTGGRPAREVRFREEIILERSTLTARLPVMR